MIFSYFRSQQLSLPYQFNLDYGYIVDDIIIDLHINFKYYLGVTN